MLAISTPGLWEFVFLGVLALLIFGPDKLPGIARNVGRTVATFKREAASTLDDLKRTADVEEFREVARDLRSTGEDLRRTTGLDETRGGRRRRALPEEATPELSGPPPFDPDAT